MARNGPDCSARAGRSQRNSPDPRGASRGRCGATGRRAGSGGAASQAQPGPDRPGTDDVRLPLLLHKSPANPTGRPKNPRFIRRMVRAARSRAAPNGVAGMTVRWKKVVALLFGVGLVAVLLLAPLPDA